MSTRVAAAACGALEVDIFVEHAMDGEGGAVSGTSAVTGIVRGGASTT